MYTDIVKHCRSCDVCQKHVKVQPKACPMQVREVVSVPSEQVCIGIVGAFPKANGEFEDLLKYIDVTTRWPEAISLQSTKVINQLKKVFSRNGFLTTILTMGDNFVVASSNPS